MPASKYDRAHLANMAAEGLTARQMADRLGVSRSALIGACHRANVTINGARENWAPNAPKGPRVMPVPVPHFAAYGYVSLRRVAVKPARRCMWIDCCDESIDYGKPYCVAHAYRAGVVLVGSMG